MSRWDGLLLGVRQLNIVDKRGMVTYMCTIYKIDEGAWVCVGPVIWVILLSAQSLRAPKC